MFGSFNQSSLFLLRSFAWNALRTIHRMIFRCAETELEILGLGMLSGDFQNIHSAATMLAQCFILFSSPTEILSKYVETTLELLSEDRIFRL